MEGGGTSGMGCAKKWIRKGCAFECGLRLVNVNTARTSASSKKKIAGFNVGLDTAANMEICPPMGNCDSSRISFFLGEEKGKMKTWCKDEVVCRDNWSKV